MMNNTASVAIVPLFKVAHAYAGKPAIKAPTFLTRHILPAARYNRVEA